MSRFLYWLKGIIRPSVQKDRHCKRFCPMCEHYDICKLNEE